MFTTTAAAYPRGEQPKGALILNIRLGTNIVPYLPTMSVTEQKSFITLTPGANVIKLFPFVSDDEAQ
jgi:hypothetical protein